MINNMCFKNIFYSRLKKKHILLFHVSKIILPDKKDLGYWGGTQNISWSRYGSCL